MKKIYSLLIVLLFVGGAFAQKTAVIAKAVTVPEIDGFVDEAWDAAKSIEKIDVNFKTEVASIGSTTWQALYDADNFYVVVVCEDDNHWPGWESGGNNWEYDKPEVYWDVNVGDLDDGVGASVDNSGHYQLADGFLDGSYDTPITKTPSALGNKNPEGTYAYSLVGEGYIYEHAVPWANMPNKAAAAVSPTTIGTSEIGFDITVIDQDEGVTTVRQRANWNNAGAIDEAWNNMNDAGGITLETVSSSSLKNKTMWVSSSNDQLTIGAACNKVVISNILGQQIKSTTISGKVCNISDLSKGVYVVKAYNGKQYVGTAKFTKN